MTFHLSKKETPQNFSQSSILKLEGLIEIDIIKQQTPTTYQDDYLSYRGIHTHSQSDNITIILHSRGKKDILVISRCCLSLHL